MGDRNQVKHYCDSGPTQSNQRPKSRTIKEQVVKVSVHPNFSLFRYYVEVKAINESHTSTRLLNERQ